MIEIEIAKELCNSNITLQIGASRKDGMEEKIEEMVSILKDLFWKIMN